MISERNIKDLHLSDEQMQIYQELSKKAGILKNELRNMGISRNAIDKIVNSTDLTKIDTENIELLRNQIQETWGLLIVSHK